MSNLSGVHATRPTWRGPTYGLQEVFRVPPKTGSQTVPKTAALPTNAHRRQKLAPKAGALPDCATPRTAAKVREINGAWNHSFEGYEVSSSCRP